MDQDALAMISSFLQHFKSESRADFYVNSLSLQPAETGHETLLCD